MLSEPQLVGSVRAALDGQGSVREQRMFGGIGFMLNGNLMAGASKRGLLLRVGKEQRGKALKLSGTRPLIMRGRELADYVYADAPIGARTLQALLRLAIPHVRSLPLKVAGRKAARAKK